MPLFLLLIVIKKIYGYYKGEDTAPYTDSILCYFRGLEIVFSFVLVYLFGMLSLLIPSLGDLKFPVGIYAMTISLLLIETLKGCFNWRVQSKYRVQIGAFFFVTSDSILAINKFYTTIPNASFWIMITYLIAQFCIVKGILKMNNDPKIGY